MLPLHLVSYSAPPSRCQGAHVALKAPTLIVIAWEKPELIGREDFYYTIYYKEHLALSWNIVGPYTNTSNVVQYVVNGLQPSTKYVFRIIVHNGVSNQDLKNEALRTCETNASTADIGRYSYDLFLFNGLIKSM